MPRRRGVTLNGPYKHRDRWRILRRAPGEPDRWVSFDREDEAKAYIAEARRRIEGRRVSEAISAYVDHLERGGRAAESLAFMRGRLKAMAPDPDELLQSITPPRAKAMLAKVHGTVATRRETLKAAQRWWRWLVSEGWAKGAPWNGLTVDGVRGRGKRQLGMDDSRKLYRWCLDGARRDHGLAIVMAMLGFGASEVTGVTKRDLDDGGRVVHARGTKTAYRNRRIRVTDDLAELLVAYASDMGPDDRLWPHPRQWLGVVVRRACRHLGLPAVCPHALRGGAATLVAEATGDARLVGQLLGHGPRSEVAQEHYIRPGTIADSQTRGFLRVLEGGRGEQPRADLLPSVATALKS